MQHFSGEAIVLSALPHGENGAVVRFLSVGQGLLAGYVAGARSRNRRALLQPGNRVHLVLRARTEGQLPAANVELVESRALIAFEGWAAAILAYVSALTAANLAEGAANPRLAVALDALLAGLAAGMDRTNALAVLARYELLLLEESGFGLDIGVCALGGPADDLAYVSPTSGRAVSRSMAAGQPWQAKLLPLPQFLLHEGGATTPEISLGLALTGHFLAVHRMCAERLEALRARAVAALP